MTISRPRSAVAISLTLLVDRQLGKALLRLLRRLLGRSLFAERSRDLILQRFDEVRQAVRSSSATDRASTRSASRFRPMSSPASAM